MKICKHSCFFQLIQFMNLKLYNMEPSGKSRFKGGDLRTSLYQNSIYTGFFPEHQSKFIIIEIGKWTLYSYLMSPKLKKNKLIWQSSTSIYFREKRQAHEGFKQYIIP